MMTQTNHGAVIPMPNPNLVEAPMHCSWCGEMLPLCECPASLARSIDKERAEAIRERNELRVELTMLADKCVAQSDAALARYNRLRERCEGYKLRAAHAFADGLEEAAKIVCPEPHVEEERDCADIAAQIRTRATMSQSQPCSCSQNGDDPDCLRHGTR